MANPKATERETRNKGLDNAEEELRDPDKRTPHHSKEQSSPKTGHPTTAAEKNAGDIANLENPPQSEGPRERNNDAV